MLTIQRVEKYRNRNISAPEEWGQRLKGNADATTDDGRTLVHVMAQFDSVAGVRYAKNTGADINKPDIDLETPMHYAAALGFHRILYELLISGADPTLVNGRNQTPADIAQSAGHKKISQWLRQYENKLPSPN